MLTGRESLKRLIGKRRRFLPNLQTLLSSPIQSSSDLVADENGEGLSIKSVDEKTPSSKGVSETSSSDIVTCPVCDNCVSGDDFAINSHLDACLSRGTKRKLTQRTLFQSKFCAGSKIQTISSGREPSRTHVIRNVADENFVQNAICGLPNVIANEENVYQSFKSPSNMDLKHTTVDVSTENTIGNQLINDPDTTLLSSNNEVPKHEISVTLDDISGGALETVIVGRRFSDEKEINLEASITLMREPHNVKDPNAIKVVSSESGCCKVLGYLPRELSRYLSPLIDKYYPNFECCVTSAPKHYLDVVPVRITLKSHGEKDEDIEVSKYLWRKALDVVESAKFHPPSAIKYQQNFNMLIQEVVQRTPHLFVDEERPFLESFTSFSEDGQRLFVRLYARKGPWFRLSNISYPEVLDSQAAVRELSANGYLCPFGATNELLDDMKEICNLLTVSELREISCVLQKNGRRGLKKQDLIASLIRSYQDGLCPLLPSLIQDKTGICIRISPKAESLIWRAERLFFLNGEQDLSSFLLVDLGIVKYPTYNCIISDQIFSSPSDLLAYEEVLISFYVLNTVNFLMPLLHVRCGYVMQAIELAQIMDQSIDESNFGLVLKCITVADSHVSSMSSKANQTKTSELQNTFLSCFSASWVYSKVVLLGISFLEQEHRYKDAVHLLRRLLACFTRDGRRGYWTLRLSIDLEHMGRPNESLSVAEDGLLDPWVRAGFRMALQRRILRLGKPPRRWKIPSFSESVKRKIPEVHVQGRPLNCETGVKSRFYGEDGEQCRVEQLALQYYAGEGGWQGVHTESGIWLTIFGLLMWDIIFSDVPDVFRSKFQTAPLDLTTDCFYPAREDLIESHLQKIHNGMAEEILITSWETHFGTACRGVNWDRHPLCELRAVVMCIGGPCLASLCRHLAQDYQSWSSGMPDLLVWRFHGEYRGEAKLVEVKGPRDRLSEQQRAWLLLLMDCGFNVEVCKVTAAAIRA